MGEQLTDKLDSKVYSKWVTSCNKFNKSKRGILHLGRGNPEYTYRRGDERLETKPHGEASGGSG